MTNTANFIGQQIRYNRQAKKQEKKELEEFDVYWGDINASERKGVCKKLSEKGNKTMYYIALTLFFFPIAFAILWWGVITETGDLGTFFGGLGMLYILIPILLIGLVLTIVSLSIRSSCRKKYPKYQNKPEGVKND
jgi:hypothetical protein